MIEDLLKQWSALEPDRCDRQTKSYWLALTYPCSGANANYGYSMRWDDPSFIDWAMLQSAVESAIVDRKLRCRIENAESGWFALVTDKVTPKLEFFPAHHDKDCANPSGSAATALLKAYIAYLEAKPP